MHSIQPVQVSGFLVWNCIVLLLVDADSSV
jgi:hypothetical protein